MRLLLDTQAFLWFILNDARLSSAARTLLVDPANELLFSPASYWEIAIKVSIGKYHVPGSFKDFMDRQIALNATVHLADYRGACGRGRLLAVPPPRSLRPLAHRSVAGGKRAAGLLGFGRGCLWRDPSLVTPFARAG